MSNNQSPIKNTIIHGAGQVINLLAPFLVAFFVIPLCGVDKWGIVGVVTSIYMLLGLLIEFGANLVGVKELSAHRANPRYIENYIGLNYKYRLICCIFLTLLLVIIFLILKVDPTYYWGLTWIVAWYYNPIWIFQAREAFPTINKIIFWSKLIYVISIYLFIKNANDYVYVVGILGFSNSLIYAWFYFRISKNKRLSSKRLIVFIKQNQAIVVSNFAISCYTQAPVFIIDAVLGNTVTGIFKIIDLFLVAFRSYLGVFFNVTYPNFCYLMANRFKKAQSYALKATSLNICFLAIAALFIILFTPYITTHFQFSSEIKEGLRLSSYLLFLPIIIALNIPFYQALLYKGRHKQILKISLAAVGITLILGVFLTKSLGFKGMIIALYLTEIFVTTSMWFRGKKELSII